MDAKRKVVEYVGRSGRQAGWRLGWGVLFICIYSVVIVVVDIHSG